MANGTNSTNLFNAVLIENATGTALFSVSVYYMIIAFVLFACTVSFFLLNHLSLVKKEHRSSKSDEKERHLENKETLLGEKVEGCDTITVTINASSPKIRREKILMFAMNFLITFVLYGILPGLASYSTLPYGEKVFHMCINLSKLKTINNSSRWFYRLMLF